MVARNAIVLCLVFLASLCLTSCASNPIHAQVSPNALFQGRYLFKSQGVGPFFEAGVIIADGQGHYTLTSTFNDGIVVPPSNNCGTYTLDANGIGSAQQSSDCSTNITDTQALYISMDGSHAYMLSTRPNFQWLAELKRE